VLLVVLGLAFVVEMLIMLVFVLFPTLIEGDFNRAAVDSLTLTAVLSPAVWLVVVRPLRTLFEERGRLLKRLFHAQEQERASLSRDLHDDLGQQLTVVLLRLGAAEKSRDIGTLIEGLHAAHSMTSQCLESVRRLARGLSPAVLSGLGLHAALSRLCEDLGLSSGGTFDLEWEVEGDARFSPTIEISVFRIVQEACTNVLKHAGVSSARVSVRLTGGVLWVVVEDAGKGLVTDEPIAATSGGLGIAGIRERAMSVGGNASVLSRRGEGTTVRVAIPVAGPEVER
jgi:two-component system sensor histidine kinase UhpB